MDKIDFNTIIPILVLVFPGFVSWKIYTLVIPSAPRSSRDSIFDLIAYSSVNWVVTLPLIVLTKWPSTPGAGYIIIIVTGMLVVPVLTGMLFAWLRQTEFLSKLGFIHPIPKSWDYFFGQRRPCLVQITLKTGGMIGGYFGTKSFASSFPNDEDIYLETVCRIDPESGQTQGFVPDSGGMLIRRDDCDVIEFLLVEN